MTYAERIVAGQQEPKPNDSPAIWDLVIADMRQRDADGRAKYGTPLQANNGRKALVDAYQESLDQTVYLRQEIVEREQLNQRIAELQAEIERLKDRCEIAMSERRGLLGLVRDALERRCRVDKQQHLLDMVNAVGEQLDSSEARCKALEGALITKNQEAQRYFSALFDLFECVKPGVLVGPAMFQQALEAARVAILGALSPAPEQEEKKS